MAPGGVPGQNREKIWRPKTTKKKPKKAPKKSPSLALAHQISLKCCCLQFEQGRRDFWRVSEEKKKPGVRSQHHLSKPQKPTQNRPKSRRPVPKRFKTFSPPHVQHLPVMSSRLCRFLASQGAGGKAASDPGTKTSPKTGHAPPQKTPRKNRRFISNPLSNTFRACSEASAAPMCQRRAEISGAREASTPARRPG